MATPQEQVTTIREALDIIRPMPTAELRALCKPLGINPVGLVDKFAFARTDTDSGLLYSRWKAAQRIIDTTKD